MNAGNANVAVSTVAIDVESMTHADQTRLMLLLLQDML
jgi:hypothetical protein